MNCMSCPCKKYCRITCLYEVAVNKESEHET
jgi:hypothetical protein